MKRIAFTICLLVIFMLPDSGLALRAQQRVVYGKITAFNTYPVENIEVEAKKSGSVVLTDSLGMFSIVCMDKDVLKVNAKTFQPKTLKVNRHTDSLFTNLIFIDNEANREMAIGYGYISAEDLSYAVSHLEYENSDFCNYTDIFELLRGQIPGAQVSGGCIVIRGVGSINLSPCALFVVDGTITSGVGWLSPCQVKSIDVLKGSSASIYGAQGANGVVLIETKK